MEALALKPQESVLDIGCGHGVLAGPVLEARARYTGIDASPRLIDHARQTQSKNARFIVGDARQLQQQREFRPGGFDAAVFLLSIQDMDELEPVLEGASWAIRDGGRVVLLITHPCFRIPRQSGWGWDESRKLLYGRVDRYLTPLPVPLKSFSGGVTRSYHRPLQDYVNGLAAAGLAVDYLREIPTYKTETSGPQAKAINLANREIPLFMAIRARKF
jgi:SAM-dependent methyltransferase